MIQKKITILIATTLLLASPVFAGAQSSTQPESEGIKKGDNEFGIWGGVSFSSPTWIAHTPDARFGNIGLRYGRVLATSESVAFQWTVDAIPVAILSNPRFSFVQTGSGFVRPRESVYAWGVSPIGLKLNFRRNRRVQPFAASTGGFLYFNEDVPVAGAARFNFTFDFQGGLQIVNSDRRSFTIGYKFNHISNAHHSPINPGVDLNMVFFGFSIFK
jgi:hypothetical protein